MATLSRLYGWPNSVSIHCLQCKSKASLTKPQQVIEMVGPSTQPLTRMYTDFVEGSLSCLSCGLVRTERIQWPVDAFYQGDVKGNLICAWDKYHAIALRDYVFSTERDIQNHRYSRALYHLPEFFKRSKNRTACVKTLEKMISKL